MTADSTTYYDLNARFEIIDCGGPWDSFALDNGGDDAVRDRVIGTSLWGHISGLSTASYVHSMMQQCQYYRDTYSTNYRCDGPEIVRLFRMSVLPMDGFIRVQHRLIWHHALHWHDEALMANRFRSNARCSHCGVFLIDGKWVDPLQLPHRMSFPKMFELCDRCTEDARRIEGAPTSQVFLRG